MADELNIKSLAKDGVSPNEKFDADKERELLETRIAAVKAQLGDEAALARVRAEERLALARYEKRHTEKSEGTRLSQMNKEAAERRNEEAMSLEMRLEDAHRKAKEESLKLEAKTAEYDEILSLLKAADDAENTNGYSQSGKSPKANESGTGAPISFFEASEAVENKKNGSAAIKTHVNKSDNLGIDMGISVRTGYITDGMKYSYSQPGVQLYSEETDSSVLQNEEVNVGDGVYHISDVPRFSEHIVAPVIVPTPVAVEGEHTVRVVRPQENPIASPLVGEHTVYLNGENDSVNDDYLAALAAIPVVKNFTDSPDSSLPEIDLVPENRSDFETGAIQDSPDVPDYEPDYVPDYDRDYTPFPHSVDYVSHSLGDNVTAPEYTAVPENVYDNAVIDYSTGVDGYSDYYSPPQEPHVFEHYTESSYLTEPSEPNYTGFNVENETYESLGEYERELSLGGAFSRTHHDDAMSGVPQFDDIPKAEEHYDFYAYNKGELKRLIKEHESLIASLEDSMKRKEKDGYSSSVIRSVVDRLNLLKEIIGERVLILSACVAINSERHINKHRLKLLREISVYNFAAKEYKAETGYTLPEVSETLPADVIANRSYVLPSYIRYIEEDLQISPDEEITFNGSPRSNKREIGRELLDVAKAEMSSVKRNELLSALDDSLDAIGKSVLAVKSRFEYEINECRERLSFLDNSYSVNGRDRALTRRELLRRIRKLERNKKKALILEKEDSRRYSSALLISSDMAGNEKTRTRLESLRLRLDTVLREREEIDTRLITLYTGDSKGELSLIRKTSAIRKRSSRGVSRRFRRDMRILNKRIPLDIKEKLVRLVNELIDRESSANALRYRMKRMKRGSAARRDLAREIKLRESSLKPLYGDYKSMLKRARKYEEHIRDFKVQALWIFGTLLVLFGVFAVYVIFRDEIHGFFQGLI